jgi:AraC-like DNA-binding protein
LFADDVRAYPEAMNEVIRDIPLGRLGRLEEIAWTIASLAEEGGISRSVLAERFRYYLDQSPMAYLTSWRLQLGAQTLSSTNYSVAQIAAEVGYESEGGLQPCI